REVLHSAGLLAIFGGPSVASGAKEPCMTVWQVVIAHAVKALVLLTLAGIGARHRARLSWSFLAYLITILICNSLISLWPDRFFVSWFWMLKQALYDSLRLAIAVE